MTAATLALVLVAARYALPMPWASIVAVAAGLGARHGG
jgi:hypothetical protein